MLGRRATSKIARAREMRRQGNVLRKIVGALGVSAATASEWTRGVLPHGRPPISRRKVEVLPILERLYREGHSIPDIARTTGVPQSTLFDWRRELGLPKNRRAVYVTDELRAQYSKSRNRDPDGAVKEWAARFYVENLLSTPEIADVLHVHSATVCDWLNKLNVQIRTKATLRMRERQRELNLSAGRWNWKGGITPERVRLCVSLDMKLARECCFERDNYTCRSCG